MNYHDLCKASVWVYNKQLSSSPSSKSMCTSTIIDFPVSFQVSTSFYILFPFASLFCFISTSYGSVSPTLMQGDASPEALAEHMGNEVKRLNEQLQAIVKLIIYLPSQSRTSDSPHVYRSLPHFFFPSFFFFFFLFDFLICC